MSNQKVKRILKRELSKRTKYKTTYKDIKYYFKIINKVVFKNKLSPFNEILIKCLYNHTSITTLKRLKQIAKDNN